jgi:hypothetical protein
MRTAKAGAASHSIHASRAIPKSWSKANFDWPKVIQLLKKCSAPSLSFRFSLSNQPPL